MCFWCLLFCANLSFCYCLSGDSEGVALWINEFNKHLYVDFIFIFKILSCLMKCHLPGSVISWLFQTVKDVHELHLQIFNTFCSTCLRSLSVVFSFFYINFIMKDIRSEWSWRWKILQRILILRKVGGWGRWNCFIAYS